jgi:RNA polymerase sigma factor (sigma-70 family)
MVFLKIFRGLSNFSYTTDAAFVAWMKKIMVNECLQELRKKNSFCLVAEEMGVEAITDDDVISKLSADEIYRFITQMPVGYRTVFNLYVIEGYNHAEIAAILNISEGTSKSQLNRARKTLQQSVTQNHLYAERKAK